MHPDTYTPITTQEDEEMDRLAGAKAPLGVPFASPMHIHLHDAQSTIIDVLTVKQTPHTLVSNLSNAISALNHAKDIAIQKMERAKS